MHSAKLKVRTPRPFPVQTGGRTALWPLPAWPVVRSRPNGKPHGAMRFVPANLSGQSRLCGSFLWSRNEATRRQVTEKGTERGTTALMLAAQVALLVAPQHCNGKARRGCARFGVEYSVGSAVSAPHGRCGAGRRQIGAVFRVAWCILLAACCMLHVSAGRPRGGRRRVGAAPRRYGDAERPRVPRALKARRAHIPHPSHAAARARGCPRTRSSLGARAHDLRTEPIRVGVVARSWTALMHAALGGHTHVRAPSALPDPPRGGSRSCTRARTGMHAHTRAHTHARRHAQHRTQLRVHAHAHAEAAHAHTHTQPHTPLTIRCFARPRLTGRACTLSYTRARQVIDVLARAGAVIDAFDLNGRTPTMAAARGGQVR